MDALNEQATADKDERKHHVPPPTPDIRESIKMLVNGAASSALASCTMGAATLLSLDTASIGKQANKDIGNPIGIPHALTDSSSSLQVPSILSTGETADDSIAEFHEAWKICAPIYREALMNTALAMAITGMLALPEKRAEYTEMLDRIVRLRAEIGLSPAQASSATAPSLGDQGAPS